MPLLEFREWLATTIDPARKREFRDIKGRDGRVILKKDGTPAARTYKLEVSKLMLSKVLHAQQQIRLNGPNPDMVLIDQDELLEIRQLWRTERQDWEDSVPQIVREATGQDQSWPVNDDVTFDGEQKALLSSLCDDYAVPFDLVARLLEVERQSAGMARRSGVQKDLTAVLAQEWRNEEALMTVHREPEYRPAIQLPLL